MGNPEIIPTGGRSGNRKAKLIRKLLDLLRERGFLEMLRDGKTRIVDGIRGAIDRRFDLRYGTDTSGIIKLSDLSIKSKNVNYGVYYQPTPTNIVKQILNSLNISYEKFTFVDFGSGKGRALLIASNYPFKRIVGVEFASDLHRIAEENIRIYKSKKQRCFHIESLCMDAVDYPIPQDPTVFFFYAPFKPTVMSAVLANIRETLASYPRKILIVFYGSNSDIIDVVEQMGFHKQQLNPSGDFGIPAKYRTFVFSN